MKPKRIQRKRIKGWKMPANTIYVGRPTKWGNRFKVKTDKHGIKHTAQEAVDNFKDFVFDADGNYPLLMTIREELKGKNLVCWCSLNQPCHADILLRIANG